MTVSHSDMPHAHNRNTIGCAPLPAEQPLGQLEEVAYSHGPMPTGVAVSHEGRILVNFPKWGDDVDFTVAVVVDGEAVAYLPMRTLIAVVRTTWWAP